MSRLDFIKELARLLDDLPREEKIEILKYYNGYFDDAGEENEAAIIAELGSPEKVAAEVKAGMQEDLSREGKTLDGQSGASQADGSMAGAMFEESKETEGSYQYDQSKDQPYVYGEQEASRRKRANGWKTIAIIAILMVTFPVWIGLLGGLLGLVGGAIGLAVSLIVGLFGLLIGVVVTAVACVIDGIATLVVAPITGMLSLAVGIFLLGLMLLVGLLIGLIFGKLIPWIIKSIGKLFQWFRKSIGGIVDGVTGRR